MATGSPGWSAPGRFRQDQAAGSAREQSQVEGKSCFEVLGTLFTMSTCPTWNSQTGMGADAQHFQWKFLATAAGSNRTIDGMHLAPPVARPAWYL